MRNPNGYGSVVKLAGNRRNPYAVRKTSGWNEKGYPIYTAIGYYPTREAGMIALARYNNDPWDLDKEKTTFEELYKLWKEKKAPKLGTSNRGSLESAYKHCSALYKMKYKSIKAFHMQECVDGCGLSYSSQGAIKNLFNHLDRFALELDIINRRYSDLVTSAPIPETSKIPFTEEELRSIWDISETPWADSVLTLHYTGFRISELLDLRTADVDLENGTMKGGGKTRAGKGRIVPIHSLVLPLIQKRVNDGGDYLFGENGKKVSNGTYYKHWNEIMETIGAKHTPHECRHTFRSRP